MKEVENHDSYYTVHHISVPCYMLQHNEYSREGWFAVRRLLYQFIYERLTPEEARRRMRKPMNSGKRKFSLTRGPRLAEFDDIAWTRTIAGIRFDSADHYCADVREWAKSILSDTEFLLIPIGH